MRGVVDGGDLGAVVIRVTDYWGGGVSCVMGMDGIWGWDLGRGGGCEKGDDGWIVDRGDNKPSPLPKQVAWTVVLRGRMARAGML